MIYFFMLFSDENYSSRPMNYTPLRLSRLRRIHKKRAFRRNMVMAIVFALTAGAASYFFLYTPNDKPEYVQASTSLNETSQVSPAGLQEAVEKALEGTKGTYGIAVKNLKTGESYYSNEHHKFQSASLYKVWIMAVVYEQIQAGTLSLDDTLSGDVVELNQKFNIATEDAELKEGAVNFTVREALEQMITNSHNYASLLLSARIRLSNVKKFLTENNLLDSSIGEPPATTASDIAVFFEKLYNGDLADEEHTAEMITLLKRQNLNNVLPKYIPQGVEIAHKTGQLFSVAHDAGIVYSQKGDYIIAGLSDSDFYPDAEGRLARVSEAVYKYFEGKE